MTRNTLLQAGVATLAALGLAASVPASAQTIYVSQVGAGGATATTSAATAVFIDQFSTSGTAGTQITLPSAATGTAPTTGNRYLTESGSATSEGALTLSTDGKSLLIGGYNATTGTASIASTSSTAVNRVVGVVNVATGAVDTTTALSDAFTGNNIRSVASPDGVNLYAGGVGASSTTTTGGTNGVRYTTDGSTTSTTLSSSITNSNPTNVRVDNIFGGQLYASTGGSTGAANPYAAGIYSIGTGLPTTGGQSTALVVNTGTGSSPYDFVFTNATTVYVADDRTTSAGGLLQFTNSGSGFTQTNTFNLAGITSGTAGLRGLTFDGANTFYGISTDNRLVSFNTTTSSFTTLATGTAGGQFRGVEFVPAPEPSGVVALALGAGVLGLMVARRRKVTA